MKLLVIGNGGREHALAWRLAQSPRVEKVFVAPGNAGTAVTEGLENLPVTNLDQLADFAEREGIAFTLVVPKRRSPPGSWTSSAPGVFASSGPRAPRRSSKAPRTSPRLS